MVCIKKLGLEDIDYSIFQNSSHLDIAAKSGTICHREMRKMGKMLHNAWQKAAAERRGQTTHITPQA